MVFPTLIEKMFAGLYMANASKTLDKYDKFGETSCPCSSSRFFNHPHLARGGMKTSEALAGKNMVNKLHN